MAADAATALALSAVFELCVPGASQGRLDATFPRELVVPLTDEEKVELADVIEGDDEAFRIKSDLGFILMTVKGGFCRITTAEGDTSEAARLFREKLKAVGGVEDGVSSNKGFETINEMIWFGKQDAVSLVFSAKQNSDTGFFASAFGVHKNQ